MTEPEGDNTDGESGSIKIRSVLQTHLFILTLIKTKNTAPSHTIVVGINLLPLLNFY